MSSRVLKIAFAPYLLLGVMVSALTTDSPQIKWGFEQLLYLILFHVAFAAAGALLAVKSVRTEEGYRYGLSPGGWAIALSLSYIIGFVGFIFAK